MIVLRFLLGIRDKHDDASRFWFFCVCVGFV